MKKYNFYEPILMPIGEEHEASIIYLMNLGFTEEQAKQKIKEGWQFPKIEDEI